METVASMNSPSIGSLKCLCLIKTILGTYIGWKTRVDPATSCPEVWKLSVREDNSPGGKTSQADMGK